MNLLMCMQQVTGVLVIISGAQVLLLHAKPAVLGY